MNMASISKLGGAGLVARLSEESPEDVAASIRAVCDGDRFREHAAVLAMQEAAGSAERRQVADVARRLGVG